jgi:hypothetical protein
VTYSTEVWGCQGRVVVINAIHDDDDNESIRNEGFIWIHGGEIPFIAFFSGSATLVLHLNKCHTQASMSSYSRPTSSVHCLRRISPNSSYTTSCWTHGPLSSSHSITCAQGQVFSAKSYTTRRTRFRTKLLPMNVSRADVDFRKCSQMLASQKILNSILPIPSPRDLRSPGTPACSWSWRYEYGVNLEKSQCINQCRISDQINICYWSQTKDAHRWRWLVGSSHHPLLVIFQASTSYTKCYGVIFLLCHIGGIQAWNNLTNHSRRPSGLANNHWPPPDVSALHKS